MVDRLINYFIEMKNGQHRIGKYVTALAFSLACSVAVLCWLGYETAIDTFIYSAGCLAMILIGLEDAPRNKRVLLTVVILIAMAVLMGVTPSGEKYSWEFIDFPLGIVCGIYIHEKRK